MSRDLPVEDARPCCVVAARDKFEGFLPVAEVARIVAEVLGRFDRAVEVVECPIADGGEGTVALPGAGYAPIANHAQGPLGLTVDAENAMSDGTAVIEMAPEADLSLLCPGLLDRCRAIEWRQWEPRKAQKPFGSRCELCGCDCVRSPRERWLAACGDRALALGPLAGVRPRPL